LETLDPAGREGSVGAIQQMKAESSVNSNRLEPGTELSPNVISYGKADELPKRIILTAGPLTGEFEAGDLRYLRLGAYEIVRRIHAAVRDRNWRTIPGQISDLSVKTDKDSFAIRYRSTHEEAGIKFVWYAFIDGKPDSTVTFRFTGEAHSSFLSNRIGCCVLHPINLAGQSCRITDSSGSARQTSFPELVAPHQPLKGFDDIRTIRHSAGPVGSVEISFSGDRFETEDQRNWIDASFKTYCRPLSLPYPFPVRSGDKIDQSVTVRLVDHQPAAAAKSVRSKPHSRKATLRLLETTVRLPQLGLGCSTEEPDQRLGRHLAHLTPDHLRVDLHLVRPGWREHFETALHQATIIGTDLEIAVFLGENAETELAELREVTRASEPRVARWLIFHEQERTTSSRWIQLARKYLQVYQIPIASGTNADFYQLNQFRVPYSECDAICWSANPQVHAFDNASIIETLEAHRAPVESAKVHFPGKPLIISPVTLRPRFNPVATSDEVEDVDRLPPSVDPRQMSLFCAGWTIGSINAFSSAGVDSLTYFETIGWKGLIESSSGSPLPKLFFSSPYAAFPVYHVLREVLRFSGGKVRLYENDDPLSVTGIALEKGERQIVLLANLTDENREVVIGRVLGRNIRAKILDRSSFLAATADPEWFRELEPERLEWRNGSVEISPFGIFFFYFEP
jgi:hypothetical protein